MHSCIVCSVLIVSIVTMLSISYDSGQKLAFNFMTFFHAFPLPFFVSTIYTHKWVFFLSRKCISDDVEPEVEKKEWRWTEDDWHTGKEISSFQFRDVFFVSFCFRQNLHIHFKSEITILSHWVETENIFFNCYIFREKNKLRIWNILLNLSTNRWLFTLSTSFV